jgi:hypothetical protein
VDFAAYPPEGPVLRATSQTFTPAGTTLATCGGVGYTLLWRIVYHGLRVRTGGRPADGPASGHQLPDGAAIRKPACRR